MIALSRRLLLALALAGFAAHPVAAQDRPVLVFAAASMKGPLDDVAAAWKAKSGKAATISYAASSALMKQIEQGAPADVFISADRDWMSYGLEHKLIKAGS